MISVVLLEFCGEPLALTQDQLEEARCRARELLPRSQEALAKPADQMVDAKTLAAMVSLPQSWIEDQARRRMLPSLSLGKYRRFHVGEAVAAIRKLGRGV